MANTLSEADKTNLIKTLQKRFKDNMQRYPDIKWTDVKTKLTGQSKPLWSLYQMEQSGGEPDVVAYDSSNDQFIFFDCAVESPKERRSLCYDKAAWESRKKFKPKNNAVDVAKAMGIELLDEAQYKQLQQLGEFDLKTSSWLKTPNKIRSLGGAIFGDSRFDTVFIYHNGAESYYAARGFRCWLAV